MTIDQLTFPAAKPRRRYVKSNWLVEHNYSTAKINRDIRYESKQQSWYQVVIKIHIDGLVQERLNSIANALELRLPCTNPSINRWCVAFWAVVYQHIDDFVQDYGNTIVKELGFRILTVLLMSSC